MKIEVNKNKLIKTLSKADKIISKSSSLPVLACVVLEAIKDKLIIKSTNLEIGLREVIDAKILKEGEVAVPSNLFASYVSNLGKDENLLIEEKEGLLFVSGSNSETKLNLMSVEDFPSIPNTSDASSCEISSKELVEGLKGVWYAASVSNMKPELSSVYIYSDSGELFFVATDSFRLAEKKIKAKVDNFESILIPQRNVLEIIRIFEDVDSKIKVNFDEDKISFEVKDEIYLVTRVIDGNFPDYKQIIPKESTTTVTLLKNDFQNTLKVSNIFANNFNQVNFKVDATNGNLEIISKNTEKGESRNIVNGAVDGESLEINFNQKYITDAFTSVGSDSLVLHFNGNGKPMVIKGVNDSSFQYLVMPLNK